MRLHQFVNPTLFCTILLFSSILAGTPVYAQTPQDRCFAIVDQLQSAIAECDDINSNWACYGNIEADVTPIQYRFQGLRDRRPLTVLENLNTDTNGVVLMNLHLEGETNPIKTMMFGDSTLDPVEPGQHSFIMTIDNPTNLCDLTPPGLVLHTEEGQSGEIELNGVTISLQSTAFVTIEADGLMTIVNLEGQVSVTIGGVTQVLPVGFQTRANVTGAPSFAVDAPTPSAYNNSIVLRAITDNADEGIKRIRNTNQTGDACIQDINFGDNLSNQTITNPGHECLYRFCTAAGASFSIQMETPDGQLDPWIDLRGPDDLLIAYNNDIEQSDADSSLCGVGLAEPACYTIIARSNNNQSQGSFTISLNQGNSCPQAPIPNCHIRAHQGLNFREGPGLNFSIITALSQNTFFEPNAFTSDGQWLEGEIWNGSGDITSGYVRNLPQFVQCAPQDEPKIENSPNSTSNPTDGELIAAGAPDLCETYRGLTPPPECEDIVEPTPQEPTPEPEEPTTDPKRGPFGAP